MILTDGCVHDHKCVILQKKKQGVHQILDLLNVESHSGACIGRASL